MTAGTCTGTLLTPHTMTDSYHQAIRGDAFMLLPDRALWRLSGGDRLRYLNGQVTQDIKSIQPGQSRYAAVISAKGRLQGDVWISATADALLIDAPLELQEILGPRLERYIVADDAVLEDITGQWQILHRLGDSSSSVPESNHSFPNRRFGLAGADYWTPVRESVQTLPEPHLLDLGIQEVLRIENALPKWGHEMTENTLPPEVRLDELATSYSKGCYIGQEVIARLKSIGHVNKLLCLLSAVDPLIPPPIVPQPLKSGEKEGGQLTSVCFSPKLGRTIGLAIVPRSLAVEGNVLESTSDSWKIEKLPS